MQSLIETGLKLEHLSMLFSSPKCEAMLGGRTFFQWDKLVNFYSATDEWINSSIALLFSLYATEFISEQYLAETPGNPYRNNEEM